MAKGSIEKRGENSWRLRIDLGYNPDGSRNRVSKTITVEDKALLKTTRKLQEYLEDELAIFKQEVLSGAYVKPEKMTFGEFVKEWHEKYAQYQLGTATLERYIAHLNSRILPKIGHLPISDIKTMRLVNLMNEFTNGGRLDGKEGKLSPGTVQYIHRVLRDVFKRAVDWKLIKENPMNGVKKPKNEPRELDVYTQEETNRIFELLEREVDLWRILITLALTTGLRRGELLGLEWKHIDFETGTLDVQQTLCFTKNGYEIKEPKTKSSIRRISLPPSIIPDLKTYKLKCMKEKLACADLWQGGEHFFVFSARSGKPLNPYSVKTWWTRFTKRHGIRYINFHGLRHTSATLLLNQGLHAKIIQARLGHANITTTLNIYTHALKEADQAAAGIFDQMLKQTK
jgi:integrase